jgi:hypothetical protein
MFISRASVIRSTSEMSNMGVASLTAVSIRKRRCFQPEVSVQSQSGFTRVYRDYQSTNDGASADDLNQLPEE